MSRLNHDKYSEFDAGALSIATPSAVTAGSGSDRMLVVWPTTGATTVDDPDTVEWGGKPLTQRGTGQAAYSNGFISQWYILEADFPSGATGILQADFSVIQEERALLWAFYDAVPQATPWRGAGPTTNSGVTSSPTIAIPSAVGDLAVAGTCYQSFAGTTNITIAAGTSLDEIDNLGGYNAESMASAEVAGATTATISWTNDGGSSPGSQGWGVIGDSIRQGVTRSAVLAATLGDVTCSAAATTTLSGALTATLAALTGTASATLPIGAATSGQLDDATLAGAGALAGTGATTATLEDAASSSAGTLAIAAAVDATLEALALEATALIEDVGGDDRTALLDATLEDAALDSQATMPRPPGEIQAPGGWMRPAKRQARRPQLDWSPEPRPAQGSAAATLEDVVLVARAVTSRVREKRRRPPAERKGAAALHLEGMSCCAQARAHWDVVNAEDEEILALLCEAETSAYSPFRSP